MRDDDKLFRGRLFKLVLLGCWSAGIIGIDIGNGPAPEPQHRARTWCPSICKTWSGTRSMQLVPGGESRPSDLNSIWNGRLFDDAVAGASAGKYNRSGRQVLIVFGLVFRSLAYLFASRFGGKGTLNQTLSATALASIRSC